MKKSIGMILLLISTWLFAQESHPYPDGTVGEMVKLGEDIINHTYTYPLTKDLVHSKLTCKNCHLAVEDGRTGTTDVSLYINAQERTEYHGYSVEDNFKKFDLNLTKICEKGDTHE